MLETGCDFGVGGSGGSGENRPLELMEPFILPPTAGIME